MEKDKFCLVKGLSGHIFYITLEESRAVNPNIKVLADNLTLEEAQALFKISKHNQGESNEFR